MFGSRARGDFHERSDIDLAVLGGDTNNFVLAVDEETSTLLMYDIVDLSLPVQQELKEKIYQEGVVIYEKFENFCRALDNLEDIYKYEEPYDNVVLTGLVALYEICFEQSWKAVKEVLSENGIEEAATGSPRSIIKLAYSVNLIKDQEVWLEALVSRNNVVHAYNQAIAMDIVKKTKEQYTAMFRELGSEIKENWI